MASLGAGVQPRSIIQLFMPVSGVETAVFAVFFPALGVVWRGKAFHDQQCQFIRRNKSLSCEKESNCSNTSSACVPIWFCPEAPASSTVNVNSWCSCFQFSAFWSNGLASSVFIFASILLRFFIVFVYSRAKIRFFISTCEKVMLRQSRPGRVKQRFWRFSSISLLVERN